MTPAINTPETQLHWVCIGYDLKQQRSDALGYICNTAKQAEETCKRLHPAFEIHYVKRGDLA